MEANKKRQWGKPDKNGVVEHLKEDKEIEQGEQRKSAEEIKDITLKYLGITYPNQNHLNKDNDKRFENYKICRSFKDYSNGLKDGIKYASQSGYPEVTDKMIKTEMDNYFKKLQRNPLNDLERFRIEIAFEYAAKWAREQMKNR